MFKRVTRMFPKRGIIPAAAVILFQVVIYFFTKIVSSNSVSYDLTIDFDRAIPLIPFFSFIYLGCYAFWVINYMLIGRTDSKHFYTFTAGIIFANIICGIVFMLLPTTIVRPEVASTNISTWVLNMIYSVDSPYNLFPSMHCLVSWFCYIGVRGRNEFSKAYRIFSLVFAIAVCVSTQVIKQHYIVDVISAIILAEIVTKLMSNSNFYKPFLKLFTLIDKKLGLYSEENV